TVPVGTDQARARDLLRQAGHSCLLVLDDDRRPLRWVNAADPRHGDARRLDQIGQRPAAVTDRRSALHDVLNELTAAYYAPAARVDDTGHYAGTVDIDQINETIRSMRGEADERARRNLATAAEAEELR